MAEASKMGMIMCKMRFIAPTLVVDEKKSFRAILHGRTSAIK
jgi:hypothetical protein